MKGIAVVGAGWSGLAAAVRATAAGARVTLFEMARAPGGRARTATHGDHAALDNGQHILIGAYRDTLQLMREVGIEPDAVLLRRPLSLVDAAGHGLRLPPGHAGLAFVRAVWRHPSWSLPQRCALLHTAARWRWRGFRAPTHLSVAALTSHLPEPIRRQLIAPLCMAALNTPPELASAEVFLRVVGDGLLSEAGGSDILLPRRPLSELFPAPALDWLRCHGANVRLTTRVESLERAAAGRWLCNGEPFDDVVLACTATEAARLASTISPAWSAQTGSFHYEPIVTVYLRGRGPAWQDAMVALDDADAAPAQFAFDLGAGDASRQGVAAFVVSAASAWVTRGLQEVAETVLAQARSAFPRHDWTLLRAIAERRATFLCSPGLQRPTAHIAGGLWAAGDYVEGPYPATLEGAVRSGAAAARHALAS
ncbi:MAG TPA: hydroxysqualene dehydroxylase HpnE [Burkholderiaceae bacterium]|nr:hydroxysqualene dehydroxylase HpnE [Burkholderiaceae bacterium]